MASHETNSSSENIINEDKTIDTADSSAAPKEELKNNVEPKNSEKPSKEDAIPDWAKDIPAQFRGKDERETLLKLNETQKGYREHISKYGLPVKEVAEFDFKPTEKTAPWLSNEADNDLVNKSLEVLKANGVGKMQGPAILNSLMEMMVGFEIMDPPVNLEAERRALLPEEARVFSSSEQDAIIDRRIAKNQSFVKAMEADGLPPKAASYLAESLVTQEGNRLVEYLAGRMKAVSPLTGGSSSAPMGEADLKKLISTTAHGDLEGQKRITEMYKKLYSN